MAEYKTKVLIIGSGPAGYTAGIYAARAGMRPVLVSGLQKGGQLTITTDVENFPGFPEPINGGELMQRMHDQAVNVGVEIVDDQISEVDFSARPFVLISEGANSYRAESVIIATGASARWLGLENEEKFRGFGVSGCATCDGFFYRNKDVAVVGGGNTAAEEALYLAGIARSVTLVHRRDELRADKVLQERIKSNPKIIVEWDSVIDDIIGGDNPKGVTEIRVKNLKTDKYKNIAVAGVFIAIGHKPNTEIFKNAIVLDNQGYIVTVPGSCQTSVPGVFAAGGGKGSGATGQSPGSKVQSISLNARASRSNPAAVSPTVAIQITWIRSLISGSIPRTRSRCAKALPSMLQCRVEILILVGSSARINRRCCKGSLYSFCSPACSVTNAAGSATKSAIFATLFIST